MGGGASHARGAQQQGERGGGCPMVSLSVDRHGSEFVDGDPEFRALLLDQQWNLELATNTQLSLATQMEVGR